VLLAPVDDGMILLSTLRPALLSLPALENESTVC